MVSIKAVGDIMLGGVTQWISQKRAHHIFKPVLRTLSSADIVVGNLECPLTDNKNPRQEKDFVFRASPEWGEILKKAGFTVLGLANNHIMDYGIDGLSDTLRILKYVGIESVGAGMGISEATRAVTLRKNGLTISILAFTYANPATNKAGGCAPLKQKLIARHVKECKKKSDIVIVMLHCGFEYVDYPIRQRIALFRAAADAGASIVLGHHPHVVQGIEMYHNSLIAYSLGNFVSDFIAPEARTHYYEKTAISMFTNHNLDVDDMRPTESVILQCNIESDKSISYNVIPIETNNTYRVEIMNKKNALLFKKRLQNLSEQLRDLDAPVFAELDKLARKNQEYKMKNLSEIPTFLKVRRFQFKHLKLVIPYLKNKLHL